MKIKSTIILAIFALSAVFAVFSVYYENRVHHNAEGEICNHAEVIASSLWTLEKSSPTAYLTLAAAANGYERILVTEESGKVFLDIPGPALKGMDSALARLRLIRSFQLHSKVVFEGRTIGSISASWPCRTAYLYSYIILCMVLFLIIMLLFLKLVDSNRTLENRVRERTEELEKENSERRRAEADLREHAQRLSLHVQHTPLGVVEWDLDFRVVAWNNAAERIFGYSRREALGRRGYDLMIPPSAREKLERVWEELLMRTGGAVSVSQNRTKAGETLTCEWYNTVLTDHDGRVIGVASLVQDITDRMRIEKALRLTRFCFDRASIGIFLVAQDTGRIMDVNDQGCESLGYRRDELCGRSLLDLDPSLTGERWGRVVDHLKNGGTEQLDSAHRRQDGGVFPVEVLMSSVTFEDESLVIAFVRDIAERKRAEHERERLEAQLLQAQKMEAVGELAGGIAHDFNNILQSIMGYTQLLLLESAQNAKICGRLTEIERASVRASNLVRQLLTFSRKIGSHLKPVNLNQELSQLRGLLERTFPKMIAIDLSLDPGLKDINADAGQIEQVVMNLAINAMHAMPSGGKLVIETSNAPLEDELYPSNINAKDADYVTLTVSDNGIGMDKDTLDRIYEPFFTTKGIGKGTGLGLSMVYGIVKNHGAYIKCYSELGKGASFKIWFPAIVGYQTSQECTADGINSVPHGTETILLIDDDPSIIEMGKDMLSQFGYRCIYASSGEEGLEVYSVLKAQVDLVILDLSMPGMGGYGCLKELKRLNPEVRVLIASGYSEDGSLLQTFAEGASGFIGKPFLIGEFLRRVRETLESDTR
ncbi:MAG: PAS domain S-box protein [Syntrophobacteraceae bacterium]